MENLPFATLIEPVDMTIVIVYLVGVVGLGFYAGFHQARNRTEGSNYFLAGNTLGWPVIGLAMFAANISTVHLVSLAESAYKYGLVYGNFEWMAGFTLILLSLFFAPLYLRSRVPTLPDYLERRYNRHCRDVLAFFSLVSAIVIHIGVALYSASWVLCGILDIDPHASLGGTNALMFFIILLGLITGGYTMFGGLLAVVWTESVQTVILLTGAVVITTAGYRAVGGWSELVHTLATQPHPAAGTAPDIPATTERFLHMARHTGDPGGLPWYSILLGYPVLGIWYWCCDQTIVQRVLAARDERHARLGPLFCSFIKILPVFLFVLPGVLCVALVQKGYFHGEAPKSAADTYTFLITHLLPVGMKGLVIAAMLSAAMQTCSAALNSSATLFAYDVVKRWRPETNEHRLVLIGKITTVVATFLAIALSPLFGHYTTIIEGISKLISYIAPPITAVFLAGVFWKGASGKAALITLLAGAGLGLLMFYLDWKNIYQGDFMLNAFGLCVVCMIILIVSSLALPEQLKEEARLLVWNNWLEPLRGPLQGNFLTDYRFLSGLVLLIFTVLYYIFR
jgi:solute:Na+ symporter, SSS family